MAFLANTITSQCHINNYMLHTTYCGLNTIFIRNVPGRNTKMHHWCWQKQWPAVPWQGILLPPKGSRWGVRSLMLVVPLCLSVMQCCISLLKEENAITSGNDVVIIAFVCCAAVRTLKIHIQPSDTAFFPLYTLTCSSALRHIDLILSFLMLCVV